MRISDWSSDVCSSDLLQNGVGRERRRHIDDASICTGLFNSVRHGVEHRKVEVGGAALAGGHAADHLGAVWHRLLGVDGTLRAGEALAPELGIIAAPHKHTTAYFPAWTTFLVPPPCPRARTIARQR